MNTETDLVTWRILATGASSRPWSIGSDNSRDTNPSSPSSDSGAPPHPHSHSPVQTEGSDSSPPPSDLGVQTLVLFPQGQKPILKLSSHISRSSALLPEILKLHTQALLPQTQTKPTSSKPRSPYSSPPPSDPSPPRPHLQYFFQASEPQNPAIQLGCFQRGPLRTETQVLCTSLAMRSRVWSMDFAARSQTRGETNLRMFSLLKTRSPTPPS